MAQCFGAAVCLVRVVAQDIAAFTTALRPQVEELEHVQEQHERLLAEAYLNDVKARWGPGMMIETHVAMGAPPEAILKVAREKKADLIVLSTHGRSGFERLLYGSVAEAILRGSHIPVLMIPTKESQ